jgi:DNA-binding CsgD family transcriptional regulator
MHATALATEFPPHLHDARERARLADCRVRLETASSNDEVMACMTDIREWLDLQEFLLFSSTLSNDDHRMLGLGHDTAWMSLYLREGFAYADPIVNEIFEGRQFFPRPPLVRMGEGPGKPGPNGTLFRRLCDAARDFKRPLDGFSGGRVEGGRFMLMSAPMGRQAWHAGHGPVLAALFPSLMQALSRLGNTASSGIRLSLREIHLLELLAEGHSDAEIAGALGIAQATVRFHLQNLFQKLEARNRCHVITKAHRHGLLPIRRPT